jgi:hypothetical protein
VCSLKTLHGLKPFTRYDAKHCKSIFIANGLEASKEKLAVDGKQNKWSKPLEKKKEGSPKDITCCCQGGK